MKVSTLFIATLALPALAFGCGDDSNGEAGACTPEAHCPTGESRSDVDCEGCSAVDDGCGGTVYCSPDPTCETPCPEGQFQEYGLCEDASCSQRMACGELVTCRDAAVCLAAAVCPDGGVPLESCGATPNCLPYYVCGANKGCPTLTQCARDACDPGETAKTEACGSFDLPCRTLDQCGETFSCVCGADTLECDDPTMVRSSAPCAGGEICTPVTGCGETFYCHGDSI
jgi:hypothetical protein